MKATEILQTYLDRMSDAVMTGDFDGYVAGVILPFHLITSDSSFVVTSAAGLRDGFDGFRGVLASQNVTQYIRLVATATLLDERLISGHYTTHIISSAQRIVAPFPSQIVLRHDDGTGWRGALITNGIKNASWPLHHVQVSVPRTDAE